jgi:hypothetical protein
METSSASDQSVSGLAIARQVVCFTRTLHSKCNERQHCWPLYSNTVGQMRNSVIDTDHRAARPEGIGHLSELQQYKVIAPACAMRSSSERSRFVLYDAVAVA